MADSPAHRLGQIVGESLELAVGPVLRAFAEKHDLYLDQHGERPARPGKKLSWIDANENKHDLDFYHRQISHRQISLGRLDRADPAVRQAVLALRSKQALSASRSGRR